VKEKQGGEKKKVKTAEVKKEENGLKHRRKQDHKLYAMEKHGKKKRRVRHVRKRIRKPSNGKEVYVYTEKPLSPEEFVGKVIGKFDVIGTVCYKTAERDCRLVLGAKEVKPGEKVGDLKVKSVSLDTVVFVLPDGREYQYPVAK
jgi:hypothetical protein